MAARRAARSSSPAAKRVLSAQAPSVIPLAAGGAASASVSSRLPLWAIACGILFFNLAWGLLQERVGGVAYGACSGSAPLAPEGSVCGVGFSRRASDGLCTDCERFSAIPIMQLLQAAAAAGLAGGALALRGSVRSGESSFFDVLPAAVTHTIASPVGYVAMRFLPYPLYILVSSCKLVPVLLVGTWLNGVRRPLQDVLSAGVMTQGVLLYAYSAASAGGGGARRWPRRWPRRWR